MIVRPGAPSSDALVTSSFLLLLVRHLLLPKMEAIAGWRPLVGWKSCLKPSPTEQCSLLGAKGIATSNKKLLVASASLLGAPGLTTRNKKLVIRINHPTPRCFY